MILLLLIIGIWMLGIIISCKGIAETYKQKNNDLIEFKINDKKISRFEIMDI